MTSKELLRRIDERDYLTEREHREFLKELKKDLEELEHYRKAKSYIERMYEKPFYTTPYSDKSKLVKWEQGDDYYCIEYSFEDDAIDVIEYESELFIKVEDIEKEIIFYNDEIEKQYQKQKEEEERAYEKWKKEHPVSSCAIFNGCYSGENENDK